MTEELPFCKCGCGERVEKSTRVYVGKHRWYPPVKEIIEQPEEKTLDERIDEELEEEFDFEDCDQDIELPDNTNISIEKAVAMLNDDYEEGDELKEDYNGVRWFEEEEEWEDEEPKRSYRDHLFAKLKLKTKNSWYASGDKYDGEQSTGVIMDMP